MIAAIYLVKYIDLARGAVNILGVTKRLEKAQELLETEIEIAYTKLKQRPGVKPQLKKIEPLQGEIIYDYYYWGAHEASEFYEYPFIKIVIEAATFELDSEKTSLQVLTRHVIDTDQFVDQTCKAIQILQEDWESAQSALLNQASDYLKSQIKNTPLYMHVNLKADTITFKGAIGDECTYFKLETVPYTP